MSTGDSTQSRPRFTGASPSARRRCQLVSQVDLKLLDMHMLLPLPEVAIACVRYIARGVVYFSNFSLLISPYDPSLSATSSYIKNIQAAFGTTLNMCAVNPPYSPAIPSSLATSLSV